MLAVLGHIVQQNFRFPGYISPSADLTFADCPNGLGAISTIPLYGLVQIFLFIGFLETQVGAVVMFFERFLRKKGFSCSYFFRGGGGGRGGKRRKSLNRNWAEIVVTYQ